MGQREAVWVEMGGFPAWCTCAGTGHAPSLLHAHLDRGTVSPLDPFLTQGNHRDRYTTWPSSTQQHPVLCTSPHSPTVPGGAGTGSVDLWSSC